MHGYLKVLGLMQLGVDLDVFGQASDEQLRFLRGCHVVGMPQHRIEVV